MADKTKVVLFVDDNDALLRATRRFMTDEFPNVRVETTTKVKNVVPWLVRNDVDLVVSDYYMLELNGIELYDLACLEMSNVPKWIIRSANCSSEFMQALQSRQLGLIKKLDIDEFLREIRELLDQ